MIHAMVLEDWEVAAFEDAVAARTVGLTCDGGNSWGTGIAFLNGGLRFIATAKHNVRNCDLARLQFAYYLGGLVRSRPGQLLKPATRLRHLQAFPIAHKYESSNYDLALLRIAASDRLPEDLRFDELTFSKPNSSEEILVLGYQYEEFSKTSQGPIIAHTASNWTTGESTVPKSVGTDPNRFFLAKQQNGAPGGYSGSGAWQDSKTNSTVWVVRPQLVGMAVSAFQRHSLVKLIRGDVLQQEISSLLG